MIGGIFMKVLRRRKNIILISAIILIFLIITLIINALLIITRNTNEENKQTEISIYNCFGNYSSKNIALSNLIENFSESNPNTKISNTSLSSEIFYKKLHADFSAGCGADIIIAPPSYDMLQLYKRNYIATLDSEFEKDVAWAKTFDKNILRTVTDNGNIYALPTDVEYILLFVNSEIFKKYNLPIPKSYDDFKNVVSFFSGTEITPIAFTNNDINLPLYQILVAMLSNNSNYDNIDNTYKTAMNCMKELYSMGAFADNFSEMSPDETKNLFLSGSAAMMIAPSSFVAEIDQYASTGDFNYTDYINQFNILAFPSEDQTSWHSVVFSTIAYNAGEFTIFISKDAYKNKHDDIMQLVKFLTSQQALRDYLALTNDIMSIKHIENAEYKTRLVSKCIIAVNTATKFTYMPIDATYRYIWWNQFAKNIPAIFNDQVSFDDIMLKAKEFSSFTDFNKGNE